MKEYEIWIEGYAATGEHSTASLIGRASGETFDEACINFRQPDDIIRAFDKEIIVKKGAPLELDKNQDGSLRRGSYRGYLEPGVDRMTRQGNYSIWACQLFDNEADARVSFG